MSLDPQQLEAFVDRLLADRERWLPHVRHAHDERVYAQIWDDDEVNAWLICWSEDQDTGFHDHDLSGAAIRVIEGQVREDRLRLAGEPQSRVIGPGQTFHVPPSAIHRVLHAGERPAVTIHAYSPPLTRTGAYHLGPTGVLERIPQDGDDELHADAALVAV